jgi:predicted O-methyltransferase YrrM
VKTIKKESLPCPEKLPGPHSVIFFINRQGLVASAICVEEGKLEVKACYTTPAEKVRGILGIAAQVNAKRAFEIGTCAGGTAANLYLAGMHVETIDLAEPLDVSRDALTFDYSDDWILVPQNRMFIRGMHLPITCHVGDTRTWKPGSLAGTFDLVFVDGDHSTAMVKNDTALALDLLRPGGTIVWDDAGIESVAVVLRDFEQERGEVTLVECGAVSNGRDWPIAVWPDPLNHA